MHTGEEADLDILADLIDEEDDTQCHSIHNDHIQNAPFEHSSTPAIGTNDTASKSDSQNCSGGKEKVQILKDIATDIFSKETDYLICDSENDVLTDKVDSRALNTVQVKNSLVHTGDTDSSDEEGIGVLTETGQMVKKRIAIKRNYDDFSYSKPVKLWKSGSKQSSMISHLKANKPNESFVSDSFSGIKIVNPLVPINILESKMAGRKMIKMSLIHNFIRGGDIDGDWVTIGVLVNKLSPKTSKNGKTYSIWKMSDLIDPEKVVTIFLFGNVHVEHWKTQIGTVIGILNPSIMPDKEGFKTAGLSLSVDHPGKFMMLGTSKDFGHCKGRRRDGESCTAVINKSQCEYCVYHVKKEYKKSSLRRTELQSTYSGKEPNLKNKILKGSSVMYGGQLFSPPAPRKVTSTTRSKDKLTLSNLSLKQKAKALESEERAKMQRKISVLYAKELSPLKINPQSEFINQQLTIPTSGSRNLIQYFSKEEKKEEEKKKEYKSITPKELLKMHEQELKARRLKHQNHDLQKSKHFSDSSPRLGRGCLPGQDISFDNMSSPIRPTCYTAQDFAKLKAIQKVKEKGPIQPQDPNAVHKKCTEIVKKFRKSLVHNNEDVKEFEVSKQNGIQSSMLGSIDLNSDKVKKYLNRKSSHAHEIDMIEMEKQESYFSHLEKREKMEEKMITTMEVMCKVVSCKECRYTAEKAADLCRDQNHPLKWHKAIKRFFSCVQCKRHTNSFNKIPTKSCRFCGGSKFDRVGMMKARSGPKLGSESLLIRGEETKFLNSLQNSKF